MAKSKPRTPMPVSERAKQFMPFAAVTGLGQALAKKERQLLKIPRKELSEDESELLNKRLNEIEKGDKITVVYFFDGEYITLSGTLLSFEPSSRTLQIGTERISFEDLFSIEKD